MRMCMRTRYLSPSLSLYLYIYIRACMYAFTYVRMYTCHACIHPFKASQPNARGARVSIAAHCAVCAVP